MLGPEVYMQRPSQCGKFSDESLKEEFYLACQHTKEERLHRAVIVHGQCLNFLLPWLEPTGQQGTGDGVWLRRGATRSPNLHRPVPLRDQCYNDNIIHGVGRYHLVERDSGARRPSVVERNYYGSTLIGDVGQHTSVRLSKILRSLQLPFLVVIVASTRVIQRKVYLTIKRYLNRLNDRLVDQFLGFVIRVRFGRRGQAVVLPTFHQIVLESGRHRQHDAIHGKGHLWCRLR